jgi:hypothetical protein
VNNIIRDLYNLQDKKYKELQSKILPTLDPNTIIGVRTPDLKKYAKTLFKENNYQDFINSLPHKYYEENQLHMFIISKIKDYDECLKRFNEFLPYVDNWSTCDQSSPKVFKKNSDKLINEIKVWIKSKETYTIRFGISMLMRVYLDKDFDKKYLEMVSKIKSKEYYVNMMIAWYFATALAKQYDATIPYIENKKLDKWVHNKSIQKALESYRVSDSHKEYLRSLK